MEIKASLMSTTGEAPRNCASAGVHFFQVFASSSGTLGLSRSCDYAASNSYLTSMIAWRRTAAMTGQSNLWGAILGTGLAGGGSGAAGRHGDTSTGGATKAAHETADYVDLASKQPELGKDGYPKEFHQRDPATADFVVAHRELTNPIEIKHKSSLANLETEGFAPVRGLQVDVETRAKDDKVLLICNLPVSTRDNHDGVSWTFKRGTYLVGPQFLNWTHDLGRVENVLMPWLDEPGKERMKLDYTVNGRLKGGVQVSAQQDRRQLSAVVLPGAQVTSARSHEPLAVTPGKWHDVPGLQQISWVNEGEKVLVVCSIKYTALWSDEMTRGRFTIFRDGTGLDSESFGLQSVRALQQGLKRTLVMALVDEPEAGPHVYTARAAVTTEEEKSCVCHLDDDDRQLALIRLPGHSVFGPFRCQGVATVDEDKWTEVPGLAVTATVKHSHDKVLVNYQTNFNPTSMSYEAYFTVIRTDAQGVSKNLGSEEQGMWSVSSSATGSSEYPVAMFVDTPGAGEHTYTVHARTRRCDNLSEAPAIEVGPDGTIAAVLLESKRGGRTVNLLDQIAEEMGAANGDSVPN